MQKVPTMIIDDEEMDRYILRRTLSGSDRIGQVFEAENGQVALDFMLDYDKNRQQYLNQFPPLLVFLDINMHLMNGFEFLEHFAHIRQNSEKYQTIIFTMFTSSESKEDKEKAGRYDFVKGYICKGNFSLHNLEGILQQQFTMG